MIQAEKIQDLINAEYVKIREIQRNITRLRNERDHLSDRSNNNRVRNQFIKACPVPTCRGFLSSQCKFSK